MSRQNIIKLNVGGIMFQTTKSTLTRFDGFFKTMLETEVPVSTDDSGTIFVDRPAKHFELILNYMRDGDVAIPNSDVSRKEILKEAQFYQLAGLVKLCKPKIYYLKSYDNILNVLLHTKKKAVLVVFNQVVRSFEHASMMTLIVDKYRDVIDIYFYLETDSSSDPNQWKFGLHLKSVNRMVSGTVYELDKVIQESMPVEDDKKKNNDAKTSK